MDSAAFGLVAIVGIAVIIIPWAYVIILAGGPIQAKQLVNDNDHRHLWRKLMYTGIVITAYAVTGIATNLLTGNNAQALLASSIVGGVGALIACWLTRRN